MLCPLTAVSPRLRLCTGIRPAMSAISISITFFRPVNIPADIMCYHSPRKYLSTQPEALMLENVII
ncbi:hypothetical protein F6R83_07630 [Citrobacter amalonaticus]|nr:hypothetical protein [Citrobacter amalonaticus]